jgi:hypothetical protein
MRQQQTIRRGIGVFVVGIVLLMTLTSPLKAEPAGTIIDQAHRSRLWIDTVRFPDSIMVPLLNIELRRLAYEDRAAEKSTQIALDASRFDWALPANYFAVSAVILNVDPTKTRDAERQLKALKYVNPSDVGQTFSYGRGRPMQYTIWNDSIRLDQASSSLLDTITVMYWADVDTLVSRSTTLPIKNRYRSILFDRLIVACLNRLTFPSVNATNLESIQSTTPAGKPTEVNK